MLLGCTHWWSHSSQLYLLQKLFRKIKATATQSKWAFDKSLVSSVGAQGAGSINALAAIESLTEVSPSQLQLRGLEALKKETITITNRSKRSKTYLIEHKPAGLTNYDVQGEFPSFSNVAFSVSRVRISSGGSSEIIVTFTPPDVNANQTPVYSGFLTIKSDDQVVSVSYFGAPFNRRTTPQLSSGVKDGIKFNALYPYEVFSTRIWNSITELGYYV